MELYLEVDATTSLVEHITSLTPEYDSELLDVTIFSSRNTDSASTINVTLPQKHLKNIVMSVQKNKSLSGFKNRVSSNCKPHGLSAGRFEVRDHLTSKLQRPRNVVKTKVSKVDGVSIDVCKPLMEVVKRSLCQLEASIDQAGDQSIISEKPSKSKESQAYRDTVAARVATSGDSQQIYTTANTFANIKKLLYCENRNEQDTEDEKLTQPCSCQRCAMVNLLIESQKRPVMLNSSSKDDVKQTHPRKDVRHKERCGTSPVNKMVDRVERLEKRMTDQEERAVCKQYFKKVITRLVEHLRPQVQVISRPITRESSRPQSRDQSKYVVYGRDPQIYNLLRCGRGSKTSSKQTSLQNKNPLLYWGSEPVTTGFDLKSEVSTLVEEKLKRFLHGKRSSMSLINSSVKLNMLYPRTEVVPERDVPHPNLAVSHLEAYAIPPASNEDSLIAQLTSHKHKLPLKSYCRHACKTCSNVFNSKRCPFIYPDPKREGIRVSYMSPDAERWKCDSETSNMTMLVV